MLTHLTAVSLLLFAAGCAVKIRIPQYQVPPRAAPGRFVAGRARLDITPPPGYPMGGHSIAGRVARGYWTRLYARAFFFRDSAGRTLALVSCDLFAIPAGLHAEVSRLVAKDNVSLPPEALILAATHTHHGPGNYMSSAAYNFGGPLPGFDRQLFDFLAQRIAQAILDAARDAGASAAIPHRVVLHSGYALNLQRNRAIDAFFRNRRFEDFLENSKSAGQACPEPSDLNCPRYLAVDPSLHVLEVSRQGDRIALLVFYAIHATAMTHDSPLYSSDLIGRAMTSLERDSALVAGFFNGAEGDVSPRWTRQNREDVLVLGDRLVKAVHQVLSKDGPAEDNPELFAAAEAFPSSEFGPRPQFGVAAFGGAEDGRTVFYNYGWHAGVVRAGAADKKVSPFDRHNIAALKVLKLFLESSRNFPARFPVSMARIGNILSIGAIPVEMTTLMGERVREALALLEPRRKVVLVGLANEYLSYVTTPCEYDAQNYEGASTIFGRQEGGVIEKLLESVANKPSSAPHNVASVTFNAGGKAVFHFGPRFFGERRNSLDEDLDPLLPDSTGRVACRTPRFEWEETSGDDWKTSARRAAVLRKKDGNWTLLEDDTGSNLLTVLVDGIGKRRWAAIWIPPAAPVQSAEYMFRIQTPTPGAAHCSQPFQLEPVPAIAPTPPVPEGKCPGAAL